MKGIIFDIQRFAIHDGPGIRTTVFLKGCLLNCMWCCNPESQHPEPQLGYDESKCAQCLKCVWVCPTGALSARDSKLVVDFTLCDACGVCIDECPERALKIFGYEADSQEVIDYIARDLAYFEKSGGGLTISGGDPLYQPAFTLDLLQRAKALNISTCMETSAFAEQDVFQKFLPWVDYFYIDYKVTGEDRHKEYTGIGSTQVLENIDFLCRNNAHIVLRCTIIPDINDKDAHFKAIGEICRKYKSIKEVHILPYHSYGKSKYRQTGMPLPHLAFEPTDHNTVNQWINKIKQYSFNKVPIKNSFTTAPVKTEDHLSAESGLLPGIPVNAIFPHHNKNRYTDDPNATVGVLKKFTDTFLAYSNALRGIREVECLRVQFPICFCDLEDHDLFAGRFKYPAIGFGPQAHTSFGYYLQEQELERLLHHKNLDPGNKPVIEALRHFWQQENDVIKTRKAYPEKMQQILDSDAWFTEPIIGAPLYRMAGTQPDYDKLVQQGIPGLKTEIYRFKNKPGSNADSLLFYESLDKALDLFSEVASYYADMAVDQRQSASPARHKELLQIETVIRNIAFAKPETFREAIQLVFLYASISGTYNYGRMDEYLGDLYVQDLESGQMTEEEAVSLLSNLWYLMDGKGQIWDCRVIIGGKGRRNENNANRMAKVIIETTKRVKGIVPQTTLRLYQGQDPELLQMALDVIATGNPYPMLYNDDVNIPAVMNAFKLPFGEAVHYVPFGCGEYVIYHKSVGTPSGVINMLQALLVTLHRGINPTSGKPMGLPPDQMGDFKTFEDLFNAYKKQIEYYAEQLAWQEKLEYDIAGSSADYLFLSLLFDDCLEHGNGIFNGGVRYLGGTVESYGNTNVADSLVAIRNLVFEEKKLSIEKLTEILDHNFEGFEKEHSWMLDCPKFGNDNDIVDAMRTEADNHLNTFVRDMAARVGLHSYLNVIINNDANTTMGLLTAASPDGRKAFTPMANANAPSGGADKNGLTALLNSMVKPDPSWHAGAVQNLKLSRELLTTCRKQTDALIQVYFDKGGAQLMINCIDRNDLENAMKEPEKYGSLIVRVGGFSARFIDLSRDVQMEILNRTLYGK